MLSLARSRLVLPSQLTFLSVNGLGLLIGKIYNAKTPDFYQGNIHSPLGWALTVIMLLQCAIGAVQTLASMDIRDETSSEEHEAFIPISTEVMEQQQAMQGRNEWEQLRFSRDSGQGTEPESSPCSVTSSEAEPRKLEEDPMSAPGNNNRQSYYSSLISRMLRGVTRMRPSRTLRIINLLSKMTNILILPLGFVAMVSGMVTYGGVFVRPSLVHM